VYASRIPRSKALSSVQDKSLIFSGSPGRHVKACFPLLCETCECDNFINKWCAIIAINPINPVDAINITDSLVNWRIVAIVALDLRWPPSIIEERDRAGYISLSVSVLVLAPRRIAGFRLTLDSGCTRWFGSSRAVPSTGWCHDWCPDCPRLLLPRFPGPSKWWDLEGCER